VNALDVTTVIVSDEASGSFIVKIDTPNWADIHPGDDLTVYLNTDRNRSNNDGGAEFSLFIEGTTPSCGLYRWNGAIYVLVRTLFCTFNRGTTFTFSRADVGGPLDFEFWMRSRWVPTGESDQAPDAGWWIYDPTPPETTILSGPSGSVTDTSASFTFNSNEAATFRCSLDGAPFAACGSPAGYQNLAYGAHTFQVRATDTVGNTDPSPAVGTWTVVDRTAPTATAVRGECCDDKGIATITYTIGDNTGRAKATIAIYQIGRSTPAKVCPFGLDQARTFKAPCEVPLSARGWLSFCVQARDAAGNDSPASCKRLIFERLHARVFWRFTRRAGRAVRIDSFRLRDLEGGKASIRCRGCRLRRGRPVRSILRVGARIEVRVVKPRIRGTYIRLTNVRGSLRQFNACLPPGVSGPVILCGRTS
jgi:hypothetical protein